MELTDEVRPSGIEDESIARTSPAWPRGCTLALVALTACSAASGATEEPRQPAAALVELALVGETRPLAVVAGPARPQAAPFYGTDLGWTFTHGDDLWVMFGDTWADIFATSIKPDADDALGKISLRDFPDGDSVETWIERHPPPLDAPAWHAAAPPVRFSVDSSGQPVPMRPLRDGVSLTSGPGLTPVAGFSNGRSDHTAAAFGLFLRNEPVTCASDGSCADGFECDTNLGRCAPHTDLSPTCVIGTTTCMCMPVGRGLCQDRTSSVYDESAEGGRTHAVVMRQVVGNALRASSTIFPGQSWDTRRFFNATVRTVRDFDPARRGGIGNDYRPADGSGSEREGVFVWGRPNFGGVGADGRDARLYLAWVPMPSYDELGQFRWEPRYYAGIDEDGRPVFVPRQVDSQPLDLDAHLDGEQPNEVLDIVGQMAISWVPSLGRFVMLYGGGIPTELGQLIFGTDTERLVRDPLRTIYIRHAAHPWGPWSPPSPLLISGSVEDGVIGQYGPGGMLYHGDCVAPSCAPGELAFFGQPREWGRLYAPNIIDPWTETRRDGSVDLYWHVSTWNPYQVVLMKTKLTDLP